MIGTRISHLLHLGLLLGLIFITHSKPQGGPRNDTTIEKEVQAKDLKFSFVDGDELPGAFSDQFQQRSTEESEPTYNPCKDSSGGICIPVGQCTADLKPSSINTDACDNGEECCLGGPPSESPCKNRGGECVEKSRCGRNLAQLKTGTECNHPNGETCCIWLY